MIGALEHCTFDFGCRIACGEVTVEASNPQSAWQKLQGDKAAQSAKTSRQEGLQMFGLKHRTVCRRIQQLPGAERCERYCCWPDAGTGKGEAEGPRTFPQLVTPSTPLGSDCKSLTAMGWVTRNLSTPS
jgi:hypothetical protein